MENKLNPIIRFIPKDCIQHIFKFITKSQKFSLSHKFIKKELSPEITIKKVFDYRRFVKWSHVFKPTTIDTVIISIEDNTSYFSFAVDYMPPCVTTVIIDKIKVACYGNERVSISDTVETLVFKDTQAYVASLPTKLKTLILETEFRGVVSYFNQFYTTIDDPTHLNTIVLKGYSCCVSRFITNMPDMLKKLIIYPSFNAEIVEWPQRIETLQVDTTFNDEILEMIQTKSNISHIIKDL